MMDRVKVIIPTCLGAHVSETFPTMRTLSHDFDVTMVYVVNAEINELHLALVAELNREVRWLVLREKIGYVRAANLGYQVAEVEDADYVLLLNDDILLFGDILEPMIGWLKEHPRFQVAPYEAVKRLGMDGFAGDGTKYLYAEGWCFMATGRTIREAGGLFDPAYSPGYCEDADLSIRIQEVGGGILGIADLPAHHLRSQTFGSQREPFWSENRRRLIERWGLPSCRSN